MNSSEKNDMSYEAEYGNIVISQIGNEIKQLSKISYWELAWLPYPISDICNLNCFH